MEALPAISAISPVSLGLGAAVPATPPAQVPAGGFGDLLSAGLETVNVRIGRADALVQAFAEGETIPMHQITLALEEARLAVEIAVEVRARMVETYRDFMNMQI